DLLALALKSALGDQNLFGQVLRCVGLRSWKACARTRRRQGDPTGSAELLPWCDWGAAAWTNLLEVSPTVLAKASCAVVLSLAPGTPHAEHPQHADWWQSGRCNEASVQHAGGQARLD